MDFDVAIVGAGPFGLSAAAYLKDKGKGVAIFGEPMGFWRNHMPAGMFLRSNWLASHISDPHGKLTLDHYKAETGIEFNYPIPLLHFQNYGMWFQRKAAPQLNRNMVANVSPEGGGFRVRLSDGQSVRSKRVLIATGIAPFPYTPKEFAGCPKSHVTHSSEHTDLSVFRGQSVLVVGGGQSGLDSARLLHSYDSQVELVAKQEEIQWVGEHRWLHQLGFLSWFLYSKFDVGPAGISRLVGFPNTFRKLPRGVQDLIAHRATRPAGTGWQRPQLAPVKITTGRQVTAAKVVGDKVHVQLSDGTSREADHVIVATGYRVDTALFPFFDASIRNSMQVARGYPILGRGLESSIPGLHFAGKPAAWSFGPLLNFISGSHFASAELMRVMV